MPHSSGSTVDFLFLLNQTMFCSVVTYILMDGIRILTWPVCVSPHPRITLKLRRWAETATTSFLSFLTCWPAALQWSCCKQAWKTYFWPCKQSITQSSALEGKTIKSQLDPRAVRNMVQSGELAMLIFFFLSKGTTLETFVLKGWGGIIRPIPFWWPLTATSLEEKICGHRLGL